ncbi:DUF6446 family protein [Arenibacterium sp. CAU 1754]
MTGKIFAIMIVLSAAIAGGAMYYLQVYGFYYEVPARAGEDVQLVTLQDAQSEPIIYDNFQAIDADSSPIRYRACFTTSLPHDLLRDTYVMADKAEPRNAPGWFDCFDAAALGKELEEGTALAFLGQKNVHFGVDRIVAITDDGRGYVWHELNDCGEKAYDGTVVGEECPPLPSAAPEAN